MKISAVPSMQNATSTNMGGVELRSVKMNVNATPESFPPTMQPEKQAELSKLPSNESSEVTVEATQPLSPQFAELARRRRALQVKERALADREKALLARSQGGETIELARLKSEPLKVLLESGVTYDQLTEAILANQVDPEVMALKKELQELKQGVDQRFTEEKTQAEKQALAEMRREASLLVSTSKDFELVKETKSVPEVMRLIEETYRSSGEVLDVKEALTLYENELLKDLERLTGIEKVKNKILPAQPQAMQQQPGLRTLTNKHTASVPLSPKQRALAAFYGNLNK